MENNNHEEHDESIEIETVKLPKNHQISIGSFVIKKMDTRLGVYLEKILLYGIELFSQKNADMEFLKLSLKNEDSLRSLFLRSSSDKN